MIAFAPIKFLPDGSVATIPTSWAEYEQLLTARGDRGIPRLKFANGHLTLKMPTFEHGQLDAIVVDLIAAVLNQQLRDYVHTTPVTLQIPEKAGIEPDSCFWLDNWSVVNGKSHIDLAIDPPPDIAIEVDVTNFTNINDYIPFKVSEIWIIRGDTLRIFVLAGERYVQANSSQFFPGIDMASLYQQVISAVAGGASPSRAIRSVI